MDFQKILPISLVLLIGPGTIFGSTETTQERGFSHKRYTMREMPWSINVVRIDRSRTNLVLTTSLADGTRMGLSPLTQQLKLMPKSLGKPVAAINGDFYRTEGDRYSGDPRGLQIARGELISAPNARTSFWIDTNGAPRMEPVKASFSVQWASGERTGFAVNEARSRDEAVLYTPVVGSSTRTSGGVEFVLEAVDQKKWLPLRAGEKIPARIRQIRSGGNTKFDRETMVLSMDRSAPDSAEEGDTIWISTETTPSLKGVQTGMGGGPALLRDSKVPAIRVSKSNERHPRSAIGWNEKEIFFVQVDGRQRISEGMTLKELAEFMLKLGCESAMNLDGGGSSEIWMDGKIMNSPCYGHERSTANALVLVEREAND